MAVRRFYELLVDTDEDLGDADLVEEVAEALPANALRQIVAMTLQKAGDLVVDPKTVLTWLLTGLGAPTVVIGLLVPVREAGSLLPQAGLVGLVRRYAVRKWLWVAGAAGQATCVAVIAVLAVTTSGALAGWSILAALTVFALARSLSSISSKDVLGRTVPKGGRGRVNGTATAVSGIVAIIVGIGLRLLGTDDVATIAILLGAAALAWLAAGAVYATIVEAEGEHDATSRSGRVIEALRLLSDDADFRRFVLARGLLLVSALSPPFVVTIAARAGSSGLQGLGLFVISSGLAAVIGGRLWGRVADRSSRLTMIVACACASGVVLAFLAAIQLGRLAETTLLYPVVYLALALVHTGSRIGRKTYVIDLAEGNDRTDRVGVSNAAMGLVLLATGGLTAAAATAGPEAALVLLAGLGLVGVLVSRSLPEVTR